MAVVLEVISKAGPEVPCKLVRTWYLDDRTSPQSLTFCPTRQAVSSVLTVWELVEAYLVEVNCP